MILSGVPIFAVLWNCYNIQDFYQQDEVNMNTIKGLVILTRFDYIENHYERQQLVEFVDALDVEDKNQLIQPIIISKDYPVSFLKAIDEKILLDFFNEDEKKFVDLGNWNAHKLIPRYSQVYIDNRNPAGFLYQMSHLRPMLIGPGVMEVMEVDAALMKIRIDYGLTYLETVRLSELGVLEEGCRMCGARNVKMKTLDQNGVYVDYEVSWD